MRYRILRDAFCACGWVAQAEVITASETVPICVSCLHRKLPSAYRDVFGNDPPWLANIKHAWRCFTKLVLRRP